jgi:hypothetical protein
MTTTQRAKVPALSPTVFKYRVMLGDQIVGKFSNVKLAGNTAYLRRGAVVVDMSMKPPTVIYSDRKWIGERPE